MLNRRITSGIVNFNVDPEATPFKIVTYLGKETRISGEQALLDKRFPEGGEAVYVDDTVAPKAAKLELAVDKTLATATDACAVMGTIGSLAPSIEVAESAALVETKVNALLTDVIDSSGEAVEKISEMNVQIEDATSKSEQVDALVARLEAIEDDDDTPDPQPYTIAREELETALDNYINGVSETMNDLNEVLGDEAPDVGQEINDACAVVSENIGACQGELSAMVAAVSTGNCKGITKALQNTKFTPSGQAGEIKEKMKSDVPAQTRTIQSNGSIVNWNIDKKKPFRDVMHQGKLTRVYATTAQLDKAFPESKSDKPAKSLQLQAGGGIVNFNVNKKLPYKDVMYDYMSEGLKLYRIYGVLEASLPGYGIPDLTADLPVMPTNMSSLIPDSIVNSTADKLKLANLSVASASTKISGLFTSLGGMNTVNISQLASLGELEGKILNAKKLLGDVPADEPLPDYKKDNVNKPAKTLMVKAGGGVVNFNVDKKLPYRDAMYDYMSEGLKLYRIHGTKALLDQHFPQASA